MHGFQRPVHDFNPQGAAGVFGFQLTRQKISQFGFAHAAHAAHAHHGGLLARTQGAAQIVHDGAAVNKFMAATAGRGAARRRGRFRLGVVVNDLIPMNFKVGFRVNLARLRGGFLRFLLFGKENIAHFFNAVNHIRQFQKYGHK